MKYTKTNREKLRKKLFRNATAKKIDERLRHEKEFQLTKHAPVNGVELQYFHLRYNFFFYFQQCSFLFLPSCFVVDRLHIVSINI